MLVWVLTVLAASSGAAVAAYRVSMEGGSRAVVAGRGQDLFLEELPRRGEGTIAFARRLCGTSRHASTIARQNGTRRLLTGVRYRVPFELLTANLQLAVVEALFPRDRRDPEGWRHVVQLPVRAGGESLWRIAEWLTGDGENHRTLARANQLASSRIHPGQEILVPAALLRPSLRAALPSPPAAEVAPVQAVAGEPTARDGDGGGLLEFREGEEGRYAVYRLRPGEALYSAVVVRFTGQIYADDVNALASEIAALNGIRDVTDIPVGYEVRIPLDVLLPEYLPPDDPRRQEYEARVTESSRYSLQVQTKHLQGVTVILDPGHGGRDVGATQGGVWESVYVYDIMLRTKRLLEETTAARVVPTIRDGDDYQVVDRDVLPFSRDHRVLTTPPYAIEDSVIGVNLRWYLANSIYRHARNDNADGEKVVFLSIHADSLHPSLRGTMIYIPSARLTAGRRKRSGVVYASREEYQEQPAVEFSYRQRTASEGLSRELGERLIARFRSRGLPVHRYKPIRDRITRHRREFVPAVLRYNSIPAKVLVEVCNLANADDRRLIQTRRYRQQVAEALVSGLLAYYGEDQEEAPAVQVAKAKR